MAGNGNLDAHRGLSGLRGFRGWRTQSNPRDKRARKEMAKLQR